MKTLSLGMHHISVSLYAQGHRANNPPIHDSGHVILIKESIDAAP
jgi:hypothetical protein